MRSPSRLVLAVAVAVLSLPACGPEQPPLDERGSAAQAIESCGNDLGGANPSWEALHPFVGGRVEGIDAGTRRGLVVAHRPNRPDAPERRCWRNEDGEVQCDGSSPDAGQ